MFVYEASATTGHYSSNYSASSLATFYWSALATNMYIWAVRNEGTFCGFQPRVCSVVHLHRLAVQLKGSRRKSRSRSVQHAYCLWFYPAKAAPQSRALRRINAARCPFTFHHIRDPRCIGREIDLRFPWISPLNSVCFVVEIDSTTRIAIRLAAQPWLTSDSSSLSGVGWRSITICLQKWW